MSTITARQVEELVQSARRAAIAQRMSDQWPGEKTDEFSLDCAEQLLQLAVEIFGDDINFGRKPGLAVIK